MSTSYSSPVSRLLALGDCREFREWPDYPELVGLGPEHVPELIRMAADEDLDWADPESLDIWAPVHAWRALGQLRAAEAIEPLLELSDEQEDNDWATDELPLVFGMFGRAAIPAVEQHLADESRGLWSRVSAAWSLERIVAEDPSARIRCVAALGRQLELFEENDEILNGFLINYLVDLQAVGMAPLMQRAFAADTVDMSIPGDWEDVQVELGLKTARETPRPNYFMLGSPASDVPEHDAAPRQDTTPQKKSGAKDAGKAKSKRKQAKASRKKNRKRG